MAYKGGFYFEQIDENTLSGQYLEVTDNAPQLETCTRILNSFISNDRWESNYLTRWEQLDGSIHTADLSIRRDGEIYRLNWTNLHRNDVPYDLSYSGTAMTVNNMLIGGYFSRKR